MPRVVHFEIPADDPDRLVDFYEKTFGWSIQKWDGPVDYWLITTGEGDERGIDGAVTRRGELTQATVNTVDVPSADEFIGKVEANGGSVAAPKMAVPGVGYMAYLRDPDGNVFGIMESDESAR